MECMHTNTMHEWPGMILATPVCYHRQGDAHAGVQIQVRDQRAVLGLLDENAHELPKLLLHLRTNRCMGERCGLNFL